MISELKNSACDVDTNDRCAADNFLSYAGNLPLPEPPTPARFEGMGICRDRLIVARAGARTDDSAKSLQCEV